MIGWLKCNKGKLRILIQRCAPNSWPVIFWLCDRHVTVILPPKKWRFCKNSPTFHGFKQISPFRSIRTTFDTLLFFNLFKNVHMKCLQFCWTYTWIILKWPIWPYIKGGIGYSTLNRTQQILKNGWKKNITKINQTITIKYFWIFIRTFRQCILSLGLNGLNLN